MEDYETLRDRAEQEAVEGNPKGMPTCVMCAHVGFHYPADRARDRGHVYSAAGIREWEISQMCEYCFDSAFADPGLDSF